MTQPPGPETAGATCIVCGSQRSRLLLDWDVDVPVLCNVLHDSAAQAAAAPRGRIRLAACQACGHLWNTAFDAGAIDYGEQYENSLHFSPAFQTFAGGLVEELVEEFGIRDGTVVEIGCGKGDFLAMVCRAGNNAGIGYDPSYAGHQDPTAGRGLRVVTEAFPDVARPLSADLVVTRHLLEHLADPPAFLAALTASVSRDGHPLQYHEVPNGQYLLEEVALWDVIYEHPSHFTPRSIARLLSTAGLVPERVSATFGAQYLSVLCRGADGAGTAAGPPGAPPVDGEAEAQFATRASRLLERAAATLSARADVGRPVAIWGTGSKGVTFLNVVPGADRIDHVIDVNPRKHGRFVPLTGQEVRAPESLQGRGVGLVLVMNPLYLDEVREQLDVLGVRCAVEAVSDL